MTISYQTITIVILTKKAPFIFILYIMEKGKVNVVLSLIDKDIEYHPMSLAAHLLDS